MNIVLMLVVWLSVICPVANGASEKYSVDVNGQRSIESLQSISLQARFWATLQTEHGLSRQQMERIESKQMSCSEQGICQLIQAYDVKKDPYGTEKAKLYDTLAWLYKQNEKNIEQVQREKKEQMQKLRDEGIEMQKIEYLFDPEEVYLAEKQKIEWLKLQLDEKSQAFGQVCQNGEN